MAVNEIPKVTIQGMKNIVKWQVVLLDHVCIFEGTFGSAKSKAMQQVVSELNEPGALEALLGEKIWFTPLAGGAKQKYKGIILCDIRLGGYDGVDMRGTPWPDKTTGMTRWFAPATMPFVGNDAFPEDYIILIFFDEYNMAKEDVFGVLYQIVNDRAAGEHKFGHNVRMALAGNLSTDHGIVHETPMPLNNRTSHYETTLSAPEWCEWANGSGKIPPIFVAFLSVPTNQELLNTYNSKTPTPIVATARTIEKAAEIYTSDMPEELKRLAMNATVGTGWTAQFMGFHDVWRKVIPLRKIIADPEGVPLPDELDMLYATVITVASGMEVKTIDPLYKFLTRLDAMYVVLAMTMATQRDKALYGTNVFIKDYTKRYREVYNRV